MQIVHKIITEPLFLSSDILKCKDCNTEIIISLVFCGCETWSHKGKNFNILYCGGVKYVIKEFSFK